jgi:hypothetical protein
MLAIGCIKASLRTLAWSSSRARLDNGPASASRDCRLDHLKKRGLLLILSQKRAFARQNFAFKLCLAIGGSVVVRIRDALTRRSTRVQSFLACFGSRSLVGLKERFGSRAEKPRQFGDGAFDDSHDDADRISHSAAAIWQSPDQSRSRLPARRPPRRRSLSTHVPSAPNPTRCASA